MSHDRRALRGVSDRRTLCPIDVSRVLPLARTSIPSPATPQAAMSDQLGKVLPLLD